MEIGQLASFLRIAAYGEDGSSAGDALSACAPAHADMSAATSLARRDARGVSTHLTPFAIVQMRLSLSDIVIYCGSYNACDRGARL